MEREIFMAGFVHSLCKQKQKEAGMKIWFGCQQIGRQERGFLI